MSYVGFGVPWVALGRDRLFGDSGFLCIYEPLVSMYQQFGVKSLIYLDRRHQEKFETQNDPAVTGVWPVYSTATRTPARGLDQPVCDEVANWHLDGRAPVDFVLTNKNYVLPHLVCQAMSVKGMGKPVIYVCLNAGKDAVTRPVSRAQHNLHKEQVNDPQQFYLYMEAASYLTASHVVWTTTDQQRRGLEIAKRFLPPVEIARLKRRSMVNGCGIYDGLKGNQFSDDEVRARLMTPKGDDFSVTFLGRVTSNKNVGFILDTMLPLFAMHGIKLDMRSNKQLPETERLGARDHEFMVTDERFTMGFASREDYASKLLPSFSCMFYASIAEGYCIVPREAIYIGIPVLLPKGRPWAETAVGAEYPFFYGSETDAVALIKRIRDGRLTEDEIERFLFTRRNGFTCEFLGDVSARLFGVCKDLVDAREAEFRRYSMSRMIEAFESITVIGESFAMTELRKRFARAGIIIGEGSSKRALTMDELYVLLRSRLSCVDPSQGVFQRSV